MRELDDGYGRDSADAAADAPRRHARDSHQPRREEPFDAEARLAYVLEYRRRVDAVYSAYEAKHAKPADAQVDHAPPVPAESPDKPASKIADRDLPEDKKADGQRKPERSRLPSSEVSQVAVSLDALFSVINSSCHIIPGKVDAIAAAALGVAVAGVAWANKRWKDKHGDRPEG